MKHFIKICCIQNVEEASRAVSFGANAIGLVGKMPSGPGPIPIDQIKHIVQKVKDQTETFLLSAAHDADQLIDELSYTKVSAVQLVDYVEFDVYTKLRAEFRDLKIVQVIHVENESNVDQAKTISSYVDMILLDSGKPNASVKSLGGTGQTHNWDISKRIVSSSDIPVILAGGLNPKNVRNAIDYVKPYGVDVCSGLRNELKLNEIKLEKFISQVRNLPNQ